jgi:PKD repeat protein
MMMNVHIVRKTVIGVFLLMALMAEAVPAQNYATGLASVPSPISGGSTINSGASGTSTPPIGIGNPNQAPPNASLLAVPVVGTAPLTVDFYVGSANTHGSLIYEWNFGDSVESLLPADPYMIHVYQHPGIYTCELELTNAQGQSTTLQTTIVVRPHQS